MVSLAAKLDIVLLQSFLEVVDSGGFAVAADRLALTPSAVSGHIKRLEDAVQARLLARTTRSLDLTAQGELLYGYARNIIGLEREARARLRHSPTQESLRIGASEDFSASWLPEVLQTLQQWRPGLRIDLRVGTTLHLMKPLQQGELDVIFGKECALSNGSGTLLWEENLMWVAAPSYRHDREAEVPLALFSEPCVYRESAITALQTIGQSWRVAFESASVAGCMAAARAGFAVAVISESQLRTDVRVLGPEEGFPRLPPVRFIGYANAASEPAGVLIQLVRERGRHRRFSDR